MKIGQAVAVYGGLENSLSEHAGVITFVHKGATFTLHEQLGVVNVRVFLDSHLSDRVLRYLPVVRTRDEAVLLNSRGAGHIVFLDDSVDNELTQFPASLLGIVNGNDLPERAVMQ